MIILKVVLLALLSACVALAWWNRGAERMTEAVVVSLGVLIVALMFTLRPESRRATIFAHAYYLDRGSNWEPVQLMPKGFWVPFTYKIRSPDNDSAWTGRAEFTKEDFETKRLVLETSVWAALQSLAWSGRWDEPGRELAPLDPLGGISLQEPDPSTRRGGGTEVTAAMLKVSLPDSYLLDEVDFFGQRPLVLPPKSNYTLSREHTETRPAVMLKVWRTGFYKLQILVSYENPMIGVPQSLRHTLAPKETADDSLVGHIVRIEVESSTFAGSSGHPDMKSISSWLTQVPEALYDQMSFKGSMERLIERHRAETALSAGDY